jgi:hypothetical protein
MTATGKKRLAAESVTWSRLSGAVMRVMEA